MKRQLLMLAAMAMLAGCSTSETLRSGEGSRDARSTERPAQPAKARCADCNGDGPTHVGFDDERTRP